MSCATPFIATRPQGTSSQRYLDLRSNTHLPSLSWTQGWNRPLHVHGHTTHAQARTAVTSLESPAIPPQTYGFGGLL